MPSPSPSPALPEHEEPAWEIARLFPAQGHWTDGIYLSFTESLNQLVELADGSIEVLEMPTKSHQKVVQFLLAVLLAYLRPHRLGDAIAAPYRIRLRDRTFREPDVAVYLAEHLGRFGERYGEGADLVIEVVSGDAASRARDYEDKRRDYAQAGIPEYWIVDPTESRILVLSLAGGEYVETGDYKPGDEMESKALPDFRLGVDAVLAEGKA
jgi:Uma2 family endonuclease